MTLCFNDSGKVPELSDKFTILVMTGKRIGRHCLTKAVGTGSRPHCLSGDVEMIFPTSSSEAGRKPDRVVVNLSVELLDIARCLESFLV